LAWRGLAALAVAASALCLLDASAVHAYCRLTTEMPTPGNNCSQAGIGLAWKRQCISFSVQPPMRADPPLESVRSVADRAFATWNAVSCNNRPLGLDIKQTEELGACGQPQYNTHGPNANTIIFVDDWSARGLPQDAFGLTLVWHNPDTGEIYDADMQLNETLGSITVCDATCPTGSNDVDLQNVMTHEAGHFLGLGHSNVHGATMSSRATVGETTKRVLGDDDRMGLCATYANNSPASCARDDFVPNHGFTSKCLSGDASSGTTHSPVCSAALVRGSSVPASSGLLLLLLPWLYLRRLRLRTGKSSESPRPTSR
jgi:hypothetical protein